jgi:hypothetical protein
MGFLLSISSVIRCCHATHTDKEIGMHVFVIFSADFFHANAVDELCDVIFFSSATVGEYFYSFLFAYKHHQMSPCRSQRLQRNLHNLISPVTSTQAFCLGFTCCCNGMGCYHHSCQLLASTKTRFP